MTETEPCRQAFAHVLVKPCLSCQLSFLVGCLISDVFPCVFFIVSPLSNCVFLGREVLDLAGQAVKVGATTDDIDRVCHEAAVERGAYPSPLNYSGFPKRYFVARVGLSAGCVCCLWRTTAVADTHEFCLASKGETMFSGRRGWRARLGVLFSSV